MPHLATLPEPFESTPLSTEPIVCPANAGDHAVIHQFLTAVFQGPSRERFLAALDDPFYEPTDRLLIKRGHQIVSHLLLTRRAMPLGELMLPVVGLSWLGTLPEYRSQGFARRLLAAASDRIAEDGAVATLLRTRAPHFFRADGFVLCGRHSFARCGTHELLAQLHQCPANPLAPPLYIRPWRQVELPGLMRLYQTHLHRAVGMQERTEAYWRWLLGRGDFDHVFVAVKGRPKLDAEDDGDSIVGYCITRDDNVLELLHVPEAPEAAHLLLSRACHEAIERDFRTMQFNSWPNDPLLKLLVQAGGSQTYSEAEQGEVLMARLNDPVACLQTLCPELHRRACAKGLNRPCELGLLLEGRKLRLVISRRSVKVANSKLGRSYLALNAAEFTRLTLGHLDVAEAVERGRVEASTSLAVEMAAALFPRLPMWRPPLDHQLDG